MKKAIYFNKALNETYTLKGIKNLEHAWKLSKTVCQRMDWNLDMFSYDVKVKVEQR